MKKYIGLLCVVGVIFNVYYLFYYRINEQENSIYTHINLPHNNSIHKRRITLYNAIAKKDTAYRYFGSEYLPNIFCVKANKHILSTDNPLEIEIENNSVEFTYQYCFAKGLYRGKKRIRVSVNPKCDTFKVTFNWKKKPRIRILEF